MDGGDGGEGSCDHAEGRGSVVAGRSVQQATEIQCVCVCAEWWWWWREECVCVIVVMTLVLASVTGFHN